MSMEFRTKIVVSRRNKRAYIAYVGLFIAVASILLVFVPSLDIYIPYVFGTGVAVVVIGALIARGDVRNYGLSGEELVISTEGIQLGALFHPLKMVRGMDFNVEAYAGMYVNDGAMISGSNSDGMTNELKFESGGAHVKCGFYLGSKQQVQQLAQLFDTFYQQHIPFIERNRNTRTYMLRVLSESELEEFKKKYAYS